MRKKTVQFSVSICLSCLISFSLFAQKGGGSREKLEMKVDHGSNLIVASKIKPQYSPTLGEREKGGNKGIVTNFLISKGVEGIQNMIANRKKKYTTDYSFAIRDESFYDQISAIGPFDPTGMRFKGFRVVRLVHNENGEQDTAFVAKFIIDTTDEKINEIMNNSVFRLRLDTFQIKSAKVKVPKNEAKLNLDFEISFLASFISDNGQINADVPLGKFIYAVRNAPLDPESPEYAKYYEKLAKQKPHLSGQSFLVPRSAGYFKNQETGAIEKCYGEGLYSIKVAVKESSKQDFVDRVILYNSDELISLGNQALQKTFGGSGSSSSSSAAKKTTSSTTTTKGKQ